MNILRNNGQSFEYFGAYYFGIMGLDGKEIREKMFNVYSASLTEIEPDTHDTFRCPTCLKDFGRSALEINPEKKKPDLTIGHIMPTLIRGGKFTLQCERCNSKYGSKLEAHVTKWSEFLNWIQAAPGSHWPTHLSIEDISTFAEITWRENRAGFLNSGAKKGNNPDFEHFKRKAQEQHQRLGEVKFTINAQVRSTPKKRVLSTIHSAFLMMFYCFGYDYVLSSEADIIRKIINEEQEPWDIGKMVSYMPTWENLSVPSAGIIKSPKKIKSFAVILPCPYTDSHPQIVVLPGFNGMANYMNYLKLRHKIAKNIDLSMTLSGGGPKGVPCPKGFCKALWSGEIHPP